MYSTDLDGPVREALEGLPAEALIALMEFCEAVAFDPWEFRRRADERRVPLRTVPFGDRQPSGGARGVVTFLIHDRSELVLIVRVTWFD